MVFRLSRQAVPFLRRLQESYADRVDLVAVTSTVGYFRGNGPLDPEKEVEMLRSYFLDDLGFTGDIAVTETQFTRFPDGRRDPEETPNEAAYRARFGASVIVVDGDGVIRRILTSWGKSSENRLEEAILQWSRAGGSEVEE